MIDNVQSLSVRSRRLALTLLVLAGTLLVPGVRASGEADGPSSWDVTVKPDEASNNPAVVAVEFDSPALGIRTKSLVWLPEAYFSTDRALPVAYFLHGEQTLSGPSISARPQLDRMKFDALLGEQKYLVVAPDMGDEAWCKFCAWVDGRNGIGIAAETHVLSELVTVIQSSFRVRTDRGGRAILGNAMGATGALVLGFRHPDLFAFSGGLEPLLDITDPTSTHSGFLATQGYAPLAVAQAEYRNVNPWDLAPQIMSMGVEVVVSVGESAARRSNDRVTALWTESGIPHSYLGLSGPHSPMDPEVYEREYVRRINRTFSRPVIEPSSFSYKTTDRSFRIWDFSFQLQRTNSEFLNVLGRRDGTDLTLAGTGGVDVTTPATFTPGLEYEIVITHDPHTNDPRPNGEPLAPLRRTVVTQTAAAGGRLQYHVNLGAARLLDERRELVARGQFQFPHARVEIAPSVTSAEPLPAGTAGQSYKSPQELPAPFSTWNVEVETVPANQRNPNNDPRVLELTFNSEVLGTLTNETVKTWNYVYLPESYFSTENPLPVLYYLHGTDCGLCNNDLSLYELLDRQQFIVVMADMGDGRSETWCEFCWWTDARQPHPSEPPNLLAFTPVPPRMAESHIYTELIPLIEEMFETRTDRAGRGIFGNSMGAVGAVMQGFRHPDKFAFIGALSPLLDFASEKGEPIDLAWLSYLQYQGFPIRPTNPVLYRNVNPYDLASHVIGADIETLISVGDGCLTGEGYCQSPENATNTSWFTEAYERFSNDVVTAEWTESGIPHTYATYHGTHYAPDYDIYRAYYLERINKVFAHAQRDPEVFSYKRVDRQFSVWGYDFNVNRSNDEFLNILGARLNGRDFTLAGTGSVEVITPAGFDPGRSYRVAITPDGEEEKLIDVTADTDGRLLMKLSLGPPRTENERIEAVESGIFQFPHTRVEVLRSPTSVTLLSSGTKRGFQATLTDGYSSKEIAGRSISFFLNGDPIGSGVTSQDGTASVVFSGTLKRGDSVRAEFAGDEAFEASSDEKRFPIRR